MNTTHATPINVTDTAVTLDHAREIIAGKTASGMTRDDIITEARNIRDALAVSTGDLDDLGNAIYAGKVLVHVALIIQAARDN